MAYVAIASHPVHPKSQEDGALGVGTVPAGTTKMLGADNPTNRAPLNPSVVIILDVPSTSYIRPLLDTFARSSFYREFHSQNPKYTIQSIFHICGKGVLEDRRYIEFMNKFSPYTNHILSSPEYDRDLVTFHTANQLTLNRLDPAVFPAPKFSPEPLKKWDDIRVLPANCFPLEAGLALRLRPASHPAVFFPTAKTGDRAVSEFNLSHWPLMEFQALQVDASKKVWGHKRILRRRAKEGNDIRKYERLQRTYDVNIITLGTSRTGPAPSILIRLPQRGSILLDCGEGTWGQLVRQFGPAGADDVLRDLGCIFIRSTRIDHHGGLATLLAKRQQLNPPARHPLYLMADYHVHLYLREVSDLENLGMGEPKQGVVSIINEVVYSGIPLHGFADRGGWANAARSWEARTKLCRVLGLLSFETLKAHTAAERLKSYGVLFRHKDGWSIMYAGSDIPDSTLLQAGKPGVSVLIHDGSRDDAAPAAQSVGVRKVLDIAQKMKADHLLFTNLSGRRPYPRQPFLERNRKAKVKPMVSYAFDQANVSIGTLWKLNRYLPTLQRLSRAYRQKIAQMRRENAAQETVLDSEATEVEGD
ncbi:hypothetical protein K438DRAFT_1984198 [Mycena galopus ATCC 62051]|nr:hypothetical protein K438DRAFT_1984198 [Mycena galopus ATCC 62051]